MMAPSMFWAFFVQVAAIAAASFVITVVSTMALWPLFDRYWTATPNARSSHRKPTPQGGGLAIIGAVVIVVSGFLFGLATSQTPLEVGVLLGAAAGLAVVGSVDDMTPLSAPLRLVLQAFAAALVIATMPSELRIIDALPLWLERSLILIGMLWFVNVVNFMDGIDWMTVAEVAPVTFGLTIFGVIGALPHDATFVAAALCGGIIGFAPFNRPVARLFLGDVGSLPIGLLLSWLLILLAAGGHLVAALLLPLYYLADATITMLRRLFKGERITQAHRSHFYQKALDRGLGVYRIIVMVFAANILLVLLAAAALLSHSLWLDGTLLTAGCAIVGVLVWSLMRPTAGPPS